MKHILFLFAASMCTLAYGQKKWATDAEFNNPRAAYFVNDTFVKSLIGVDVNAGSDIHVTKENLETPLLINGCEYSGKVTLTRNKDTEWVTLEDIHRQYCPETEGAIVYMINEYIITKDVASYKLEKDYINKCEVLPGSDFEAFQGEAPFSIIRVFTKTNDKSMILR